MHKGFPGFGSSLIRPVEMWRLTPHSVGQDKVLSTYTKSAKDMLIEELASSSGERYPCLDLILPWRVSDQHDARRALAIGQDPALTFEAVGAGVTVWALNDGWQIVKEDDRVIKHSS
jgi:hypothetical protein